jgi:hypothetical protein
MQSPILTEEDRIQVRKRKTELRSEINGLNHRLSMLRVTAAAIKARLVPQSELTLLKASIRMEGSTVHLTELENLTQEYIEATRDLAATSSMCVSLERMISEVVEYRNGILDEKSQLETAFAFQELPIPDILLRTYELQEVKGMAEAVEKLHKTQSDILDVIAIRSRRDLEHEASLEITRTSESEWNIRSLGVQSLRGEIQILQRNAVESDSLLRSLELSREAESQKLADLTSKNQDEQSANTLLISSKTEWSRDLQRLNDEIGLLHGQINQSAARYDELSAEISNLEQQQMEIVIDETDISYISNSESVSSHTDFTNLNEQKQNLEAEVAKMRKALNSGRRKARKRQEDKVAKIRMLYCIYAKQMALENEFCIGNVINNDYNCSGIEKQIAALIQKIDFSMAELRHIAIDH